MAAPSPIVQSIIAQAKARGLDPNAVLAVASQEGLSGGIGDGGHAYGPFQLNNAGGVITGIHTAVNDPGTEAWANSPDGLAFALDRIAKVAGGERGRQAVVDIVSRFERPANIPREISGALHAYGGPVAAGQSFPAGPISQAPQPGSAPLPQPVRQKQPPAVASPIAVALKMLGFPT